MSKTHPQENTHDAHAFPSCVACSPIKTPTQAAPLARLLFAGGPPALVSVPWLLLFFSFCGSSDLICLHTSAWVFNRAFKDKPSKGKASRTSGGSPSAFVLLRCCWFTACRQAAPWSRRDSKVAFAHLKTLSFVSGPLFFVSGP